MPIGTGIIYNVGDLILSQVSGSGTAFLETKIAAATSSIVYFDNTARINSASLNSITVGTASYVSGSRSIITNLTASNISASGTGSFGMVGIGTTAPGALLDVNGLFRFQQDIRVNNGTDKLILSATSTTTELHSAGTTGIVFKNSGNSDMVRFDAATGNVGIGTTSPATRLHVYSAGGGFEFGVGSSNCYIETIDRASVSKDLNTGYYTRGTGSFTWNNAAYTERMRIDGSGSVLIGVNGAYNSSRLLQVKDGLLIGNSFYTFASIDTNGTADLILSSNANPANLGSNSNIIFKLGTSAGAGPDEKMRIVSNGNVGIGTTSPTGSLQVNKASQTLGATTPSGATIISNLAGHNGILELGVDTTNLAYIQSRNITDPTYYKLLLNPSGGSVGIGTSSPVTKLDVVGLNGSFPTGSGTIQSTGSIVRLRNGDSNLVLDIGGNGGNGNWLQATNRSDLSLTYPLLLNPNGGNVGIGITSPSYNLSISGSAGLQGNEEYLYFHSNYSVGNNARGKIRVVGAGGGSGYGGDLRFSTRKPTNVWNEDALTIDSSGNVGIGTSSPAVNLEVVGASETLGTIRISGGKVNVLAEGEINSALEFAQRDASVAGLVSGKIASISEFSNGAYAGLGFYTAQQSRVPELKEAVRIKYDGNVGIGTTVPAYLLDVSGSSRHGYRAADTHQFTGSVSVSGSLNATASWANNVVSASYALTSSFATTAQTANALNVANTYTIAGLTSAYVDVNGSSAPTTGIYRPSTKTLGLSADGTLIFKISNVSAPATSSIETGNFVVQSGNFGLGTNSPNNKLDIFGGTGTTLNMSNVDDGSRGGKLTFISSSATGRQFYVGTNSSIYNLVFGIDSIEKMRLDTSGYFAINTTNTTPYSSLFPGQLVVDAGTSNVDGIFSSTNNTNAAELILTKKNPTNNFGSLLIQHSGSSGDAIALNYNVNTSTGAGGTNSFKVTTDGTGYFRGNVGIGTTAPAATLHVSGSSGATATFQGSTQSTMNLKVGSFDNYLVGTSTGDISIRPSGSTAVTILSGGNVGIGTTSPAYKLDVIGPATSNGVTLRLSDAASLANSRHILLTRGSVSGSIGIAGSQIEDPLWLSRSSGYDLIVASSGNIGIGTSIPGALLEISSSTAASLLNVKGAGGNAILFVSGSGNVGIGTTSPTAKLQVIAGNSPAISILSNNAGQYAYQYIGRTASELELGIAGSTNHFFTGTVAGDAVIKQNSTGKLHLGYASAAPSITIDMANNVGIGTTAPVAKLEITGSSNSVLLNIKSAISGAILYVSGSGAVGIGTSNVGAYTLQVSGSFAATTKSFVIEHPTKAGKKLIYGSLESPYHGIRLTGRDTLVNGKCKIQLPDYIYKLILHDSVNIQLTGIKCNKTLYVDEINIPENYFTIAYDKAIFESYKDYDFFWDFTGIRADVPELITEL